jgi:hypothetical protein
MIFLAGSKGRQVFGAHAVGDASVGSLLVIFGLNFRANPVCYATLALALDAFVVFSYLVLGLNSFGDFTLVGLFVFSIVTLLTVYWAGTLEQATLSC